MHLLEATQNNSSFSRITPGLQIGIDSTSLGVYKECPRKYYYSIICGYQGRVQNVHLLFGIWMHEAREQYDRKRFLGATHRQALIEVVDRALKVTWDQELNRPWLSDHKAKNRMSLIRSIIWYLDHFGEHDALQTVQLASGRPAVELSFRFKSPFTAFSSGEPFIFCGHLDRIATMGTSEKRYIADLKSTTSQLKPEFFDGFSPGNQFSMYSVAARVAFKEPIEEIVIDGVQIGIGFTKFARRMIQRPADVIEEWLDDASQWLRKMEENALDGKWPQNDKACLQYGTGGGACAFMPVCSRSPSSRPAYLKANYVRRVWDPLVSRGDV